MWIQPLFLTLQLMILAVGIAAVVGIVGAWGASTLHSSGRIGRFASRWFLAAMVMTAVIPMILHATAWEATAGKFGWMILTQTGARTGGSSAYVWFSGLVACGWIHGLVGGALVAIACWYGTQKIATEVTDQSRLDLSPEAQWWRIRLPVASRWWIPAFVATAVLAATEMTVVDLYGFRTLADEFYLFYSVDPSFGSIVMTCVIPMIVLGMGLIWWGVSRHRWSTSAVARDDQQVVGDPLGRWWCLTAAIGSFLVAMTMLAIPMAGLVIKVGHEVSVQQERVVASWSLGSCLKRIAEAPTLFAEEYFWTTMLSVTTAAAAMMIAWPMARLARIDPRWRRLFDLGSIALAVIPGPIVASAIVTVFQWDLPGFRFLYQQTILPTVIALLARGIPLTYWIVRAGYRAMEQSVLDAASLDMSWLARMWRIDRTMLRKNLFTAFFATAIVASGDVAAALPVMPPGISTVGTRLFGLLHSGARYQEAALAIWYVAAIIAISLFLPRRHLEGRVRLN